MKERRTVQKDMIYTALQELHNHPTAEQVCAHVRRRCPTISRATVYRVLNGMAEKGSVLRIPVNNGADHYDHQMHRHFHVCCDGCGRVDDVSLPEPTDVLSAAQDAGGYELTGYTLLLHGLCGDCRQTRKKENAAV